jgi:hypothetical protein
MKQNKIIFFIRTSAPFLTQRQDIDCIISNLINEGYQVDLYDSKKKMLMRVNSKELINYDIFNLKSTYKLLSIFSNIFCLIYFLLKNRRKYNIVHLCYIQEEYLLFPRLIKSIGNKLILILYGSDINQRNFIKNNFTRLYQFADSIIATNQSFLERANFIIKRVDILTKSKVLMFPQKQFKFYQDFNFENKYVSKSKLNFPLNKVIICLGTSGLDNEQLQELIPVLTSNVHFKDFYFIINISKNDSSLMEMKEFIYSHLPPENCYIIEKFLPYEDMAIVRHATDIFINTRKNDQLAASLIESNLSYSYIISGAWLPYDDYKKSIQIDEVDFIREINQKINDYLNLDKKNLKELLENNKINSSKKYDANVLDSWSEFYKNQIN